MYWQPGKPIFEVIIARSFSISLLQVLIVEFLGFYLFTIIQLFLKIFKFKLDISIDI